VSKTGQSCWFAKEVFNFGILESFLNCLSRFWEVLWDVVKSYLSHDIAVYKEELKAELITVKEQVKTVETKVASK
jgi:hypothetical protein